MAGALLAALIAGMVVFGGLVVFVAKVLIGLTLLAVLVAIIDGVTTKREDEEESDDDII